MSEPTVPPPPSYTPPPPPTGTTPPPPGAASPNRGLMLVLAYLGIFAVIPLVVEKEDSEVQWHAKHGLVLFVAEIIVGFILGILANIPFLGCFAALMLPFYFVALLIFHIFLIVKATNGERIIIPGLSQYADRF